MAACALTESVGRLKGVGPVTEAAFRKAGIETIEDLLQTFPVKYRDYGDPLRLSEAQDEEPGLFGAIIASDPKGSYVRGGLHVLHLELADEDGSAKASVRIFNQPYLAKSLRIGAFVYVDGTPRSQDGRLIFSAPTLLTRRPEQPIAPIYRSMAGITPARMRAAVTNALEAAVLEDPLSDAFLRRYELVALSEAYHNIHFPRTMAQQQSAAKRFSFENSLVLTRILDVINSEKQTENEKPISGMDRMEDFERLLPFCLTAGQKRAMEEIALDLEGPVYMNRLVQGDVGSGKTAVALFAMYCAAADGFQSVLLAPTEVLARQHAKKAADLFGHETVALFTGSMTGSEREEERRRVEAGRALYVIGTHALFFEDMQFHRPALIIADEQQRFGVRQRRSLFAEHGSMHSLVMSATPIPRSLSLVLQGFMDVSAIDDLPPGRQPVQTFLVGPKKMHGMFDFIAEHARGGEQAYIVCPLIEPNEETGAHAAADVYETMKEAYPDLKIGLLHGKMNSETKNEVMARFQRGELQVLVSTTVIEVGVDVPNAAIMAVLDADRFGLAQLHQLRGRVGRGNCPAWCFLSISRTRSSQRLRILCETSDGFRIAEADLEERGAGELLGLRQHGRQSPIDPEQLARVDTFRDTLNDMVGCPELRADFQYICRQAAKRSGDLIDQIALN